MAAGEKWDAKLNLPDLVFFELLPIIARERIGGRLAFAPPGTMASNKYAFFVLSLLMLLMSWADADETAYPPPPGLDPDEDARHRSRYQKGRSLWHPTFLFQLRKMRKPWRKIAPMYFYRRTCGSGPPARQIILQVGKFDLDRILKDEESQTAFLLHMRWMLEAYWRMIVPSYKLEPKLVFIVDMDGLGWRTTISYTLGITALLKLVNAAFHSVTGKGVKVLYLLNTPSGFSSIWSAATKVIRFRKDEVVLVKGQAERNHMLQTVGEDCLWHGLGGKSTLPLGGSPVEAAFLKLAHIDEEQFSGSDVVRLTPEVEGFPLASDFEQIKQETKTSVSSEEEGLVE
ncbi:hypothetical protein Esti_004120 [Eimeria stiedai]